jgi:hypothetical protein
MKTRGSAVQLWKIRPLIESSPPSSMSTLDMDGQVSEATRSLSGSQKSCPLDRLKAFDARADESSEQAILDSAQEPGTLICMMLREQQTQRSSTGPSYTTAGRE